MHALVTFALIATLLAGYDFVRRAAPAWRIAYLGFALLVVLRGLRLIVAHTRANIAHPPRYDFLCFWVDGRVALLHRNVYLPAFFHQIGNGLAQPADWVREFLDIGFLYPPTSIVWFAPLGLFTQPTTAIRVWYVFLFATLGLAGVALWRQYFRAGGPIGLAAAAALLIAFPATIMDLDSTQTIGIALLFALLFRGDRNAWRAGIWIALACTIKPFLITLLIVPLCCRAWRTVAACGATIAALGAAALAIIGPAAMLTYVTDNPVARVPGYMYSGIWNQSLLGWILRFSQREPVRLVVTHETLYIVVAVLIAALTLVACARLVRTDRDAAIGLSLMLGLLIYPQTLYFYALLLVLPMAIVWSKRGPTPRRQITLAIALAAICALLVAPDGSLAYLAIAATFALTCVVAFLPPGAGEREVSSAAKVLTTAPA